MNLASVHFIEQRHHNERVEDDREMLRRFRVKSTLSAAVNVQKNLTCTIQTYTLSHLAV